MNSKLYIKNFKGKGVRFKKWIGSFLLYLHANSVILDVGSGLGYNADYMEKKGFKVIRSDVDKEFMKFQKKPVIYFDILKPHKRKFDAIIMCLVLSMFSPLQIPKILENISMSMKDDGIFTFNVPIEWSRKDI